MAQPPRDVSSRRRTHQSASARAGRIAALVGLVVGFGLLAAIAWAVRSVTGDEEAALPTTTAQTTTPANAGPTLRIVFPEGFTRQEMADRITAVNKIAKRKRKVDTRLAEKAYLRLTDEAPLPADFRRAEIPHLEGFLFPATYEFTPKTRTKQLVEMQLDAFRAAWENVDLRYAKRKNLTAYDVLIIASMVEKEVQVPKERPLVAAVIYNRLKAGMPLQIDATVRYGFGIPPTEPILQSQLESDNPYNTRKLPGLPPTPIANPGLASIQAAAHPAEVDYIYFIRKADCKSHFFTASLTEFENYPRDGLQCG